MKLLLDVNISWRLSEPLSQHFPLVEHVNKIPISQPASDEAIWNYAKENDYCIVTNDEDFLKILLRNQMNTAFWKFMVERCSKRRQVPAL